MATRNIGKISLSHSHELSFDFALCCKPLTSYKLLENYKTWPVPCSWNRLCQSKRCACSKRCPKIKISDSKQTSLPIVYFCPLQLLTKLALLLITSKRCYVYKAPATFPDPQFERNVLHRAIMVLLNWMHLQRRKTLRVWSKLTAAITLAGKKKERINMWKAKKYNLNLKVFLRALMYGVIRICSPQALALTTS